MKLKKSTRKLALSRETLHRLEESVLATRAVGGVIPTTTATYNTCPQNLCTSSCIKACSAQLDCCPSDN